MRRRLYFVLPDVSSAEQTVRDLLLARVEIQHMHCLAKRGSELGDLPEAGVLQKTDLVHGAETGLAWGGLAGVFAAGALLLFSGESRLPLAVLLGGAIIGALFGAWVSAMVGAAVPNSRLRAFENALDRGAVLLMVDVPWSKAEEIRDLVTRRHPEATAVGVDPTIPAFP